MNEYYVYANGKGYKVSRHNFKTDKAAINWFIRGYGKDPGVSLYRSVSPALNIFADWRVV